MIVQKIREKLTLQEEGYVLLEHLGGMAVMLTLIPVLLWFWDKGITELKIRSVATHFNSITKAAEQYGLQYHAALLAASGPDSGVDISLQDLRDAGNLPEHIQDLNAWGQGYQVSSRLRDDGNLAMIVMTFGGPDYSANAHFLNITVPETAAMAKAGFVPTDLLYGDNRLRGAYGAWDVSLSDIGVSSSPGYLGMISTLDSSMLGMDYLYRVSVPDHPELNEMATTLDMTDHAIVNAQSLQYAPHEYDNIKDTFCADSDDEGKTFLDPLIGLYICRNEQVQVISDTGNSLPMQSSQLVTHGAIVEKPVCPSGTNTHPEIFVAHAIAAQGAESKAFAAMQAWAVDQDTDWLIQMRIKGIDDVWISPAANYGRMVAFTTCAKDLP
jgi:hypothetical protein